jgi:hypothetical protein
VAALHELKNTESHYEDLEVLANGCRNNLDHCRWINDLIALSQQYPKCIFWKGQLGDTFLTPFWKRYRYYRKGILDFIKSDRLKQDDFFESLYWRGAMWQGSHMSQLRSLTDKLFLSIYHGTNVNALVSKLDLPNCVQDDVRIDLGNEIAGRTIIYPNKNPSPEQLHRAAGVSAPEHFLELIDRLFDIPIQRR